MEWISWIILYFAAGAVLTVILWNEMKINWQAEASDIKMLIIAAFFVWPLVIVFICLVGIFKK